MVQIKIKGINQQYHVFAQYDQADEFFHTLKERLNLCLVSQDHYFEAFFHISLRSDEDACRLFMICKECHTIIVGMDEQGEIKQTRVIQDNLRGGETYRFYEPIILLGNIHSLAYVVSSESIYVMGKAAGHIDLLHEDCVLCASILQANVRICDSIYQNLTSFSPCKSYYKNRAIEVMKYKEESQWEKL